MGKVRDGCRGSSYFDRDSRSEVETAECMFSVELFSWEQTMLCWQKKNGSNCSYKRFQRDKGLNNTVESRSRKDFA